jgi:hypothetical protein
MTQRSKQRRSWAAAQGLLTLGGGPDPSYRSCQSVWQVHTLKTDKLWLKTYKKRELPQLKRPGGDPAAQEAQVVEIVLLFSLDSTMVP